MAVSIHRPLNFCDSNFNLILIFTCVNIYVNFKKAIQILQQQQHDSKLFVIHSKNQYLKNLSCEQLIASRHHLLYRVVLIFLPGLVAAYHLQDKYKTDLVMSKDVFNSLVLLRSAGLHPADLLLILLFLPHYYSRLGSFLPSRITTTILYFHSRSLKS